MLLSATILDQHNFCDKSSIFYIFSCKSVKNHNWYYNTKQNSIFLQTKLLPDIVTLH